MTPRTPPAPGDYSRSVGRHRLGELPLWASAATLVLALHAGVAAWALQRRPEPPAGDTAPVGAVMIDLAPEPVAPVAEETQVSEQQQDQAPTDTPDPTMPSLEPPTETVETPAPVEDVPPPEEQPAETAAITPLDSPPPPEDLAEPVDLPEVAEAEVALPLRRPERLPEVEEDAPREEVAAPPKKTAPPESVRATAKAPAAPSSAPTQSPSSGSSASPAKWQSRLLAHLERRKRYPAAIKRKRIEGVASVNVSIDASGNVLSARLARSSGVPELDQEVVDMAYRASPVPAPPPGARLTFTVPVKFSIRD